MSFAKTLIAEFEQQAPVTRRFLERLPDEKLTWKPHPKSMTAGQLAFHLAAVPGSVARFALINPAQAPDFNFPQPASVNEVLRALDESIETVRSVLQSMDDTAMNEIWRMNAGEKEVFAQPRGLFLRNAMLNHWYQHRGQFGVYLRLLDIPVPASWGPSADEMPASMQQKEPVAV
jgi:uncharacterized damage-inducible protein DinB